MGIDHDVVEKLSAVYTGYARQFQVYLQSQDKIILFVGIVTSESSISLFIINAVDVLNLF